MDINNVKNDGLLFGCEDDVVATCGVCGIDRHENDVNLVDYDVDVCSECETAYKEQLKQPKTDRQIEYQAHLENIRLSNSRT